jgi:egghead protein (zeste-white 4 protein)
LSGPSFPINGFVIRKEGSRPGAKPQADFKAASSAIPEPFVRDLNFRRERGCTAIPREPVRDWRLGWMTGHRARVIAFTVSVIAILLASHSLSPADRPPQTLVEEIVSWTSLLWLGALLPGSLGLIGTLFYRFPSDLDDVRPINSMICWRIVTAGKNIDVVLSTIRRCQAEMAKTPLAPYVIEVVIDECRNVALLPVEDVDLRVIVVPREYVTSNSSRFKARALHYALLNSQISATAWIVHLDEETQPTQSAIKGVCKFICQEEASGRLRIGQGALLYHREWERHPFLTLADNVRTGDDFARFYLQHRLGVTIFGLHGSFIVVRNDVEKATGGFDFGPHGDITEDAFWALKAMQNGLRCAWVEGFLEEQSCMSVIDFLRQRRRWFHGLVKTVLYAPVKLRWRFGLGLNTMLWALAPFAVVYTLCKLFYNVEIPFAVRVLASYSFATFAVWYVTGLKANMDEHGIKKFWKRVQLTLLQIFLLPMFCVLEGLGVLWGLASRAKGFEVVKK